MKRFIIVLLSVLLVLSLFSCKEEQKKQTSEVTPYKRLTLDDMATPKLDEISKVIRYEDEADKKAFALDAINNIVTIAGKDALATLTEFFDAYIGVDSDPVGSKSIKGLTKLFVRNEKFEAPSENYVSVEYMDLVSNLDVNSLIETIKSIKQDVTKLDFTADVEFSALDKSLSRKVSDDVEFISSYYLNFNLLDPVEIINSDDPEVKSNATLDIRASFASTRTIKSEGVGEEKTLGYYKNPIVITFDIPVVNLNDEVATRLYKLQIGDVSFDADNFAAAIGRKASDIIATVTWVERDGLSTKNNSVGLSIRDIIDKFFPANVE